MPVTIRSTRAHTDNADTGIRLLEAFFRGAAPDGGLYLPENLPRLSDEVWDSRGVRPDFARLAGNVLEQLFPEDAPTGGWHSLAQRAFPFGPVLRPAGRHLLLELYHGPTCAFKDFGARFLAQVLESELERRGGSLTILTATSGDTGSAVGSAFHGLRNIDVVILYPKGRISKLQQKQLTTLGGNVSAVEVDGAFDDCQSMVKDMFADTQLSAELRLSSANSINLGRLIPQSLYYIWAAAALRADVQASAATTGVEGSRRADYVGAVPYFTVPSGNFGNLTAGVLAFQSGMPASGFLAATNLNDVVPHYLRTGHYAPRESTATISNAMDVGTPSNFERLHAMFSGDYRRMGALIRGEAIDEDTTRLNIKRYYEEYGLLVCPHTAVGLAAADRLGTGEYDGGSVSVVLATAHPGKFSDVVEEATGRQPDIPERLQEALDKPGHAVPMPADSRKLREWLATAGESRAGR
ncbi:MAG: threonine synthase [bacterium]